MGKILFGEESSTPATPGGGYVAVYAKTDGLLYYQDDAGTEKLIGGCIGAGTSFPGGPSAGDVFYRTDLGAMATYDGARWLGELVALPMANYASFCSNISSGVTLLAATHPGYALYLDSWEVSYSCLSADGSNYWTVTLYVTTASGASSLASLTIDAYGSTTKLSPVTSFTANPTNSTDKMVYVYVSKTGSPLALTITSVLWVRRVMT